MSISIALLILRAVVGLTIAAHGAQKVFGWWGGSGVPGWAGALKHMRVRPAMPWAWASALAELLGGLGVAVGFLTPLAVAAVVGTQLVAIALVHIPHGFWMTKGGFEYNLTILASMIAIAVVGPRAYSIDGVLGINFPEPVTLIVLAILTVIGVGTALLTRTPQEAPASQTQTT